MRNIFYGIAILSSLFFSCGENSKEVSKNEPVKLKNEAQVSNALAEKPVVELTSITKNFGSFWAYYNQYALLHQDFVAVNENGQMFTKTAFLEKLKTQSYLPLVFYSERGKPIFKLTKIPTGADANIGAYMQQDAEQELAFYAMKGKPIPKFSFKDVNGVLYTSENTKGKIVLFKCWFIRCGACVKEMPALNEMVQKYKNKNDVLFISLAIDDKLPLEKFLSKTKFEYATVPNQEMYMSEKLHVKAYPTHYLINKQGLLVDVVSEETAIRSLLEKELGE